MMHRHRDDLREYPATVVGWAELCGKLRARVMLAELESLRARRDATVASILAGGGGFIAGIMCGVALVVLRMQS